MNINDVIDLVFEMEYTDLMRVLKALTYRWGELYPDCQIVALSVPQNDPLEKKRLIEQAVRMIDRDFYGESSAKNF